MRNAVQLRYEGRVGWRVGQHAGHILRRNAGPIVVCLHLATGDEERLYYFLAPLEQVGQTLRRRFLGNRCIRRLGGGRRWRRTEHAGDRIERKRQLFFQPVPVLRVVSRRVRGEQHPFPPTDTALLAAFVFRHLGDVVGEQDQVRPFLEERRHLFAELQFKAVVAARLIRRFEFPHRAVGEQNDMHSAPEQSIQRREKLREFLRQDDVALAVAEILDGFLVRLPADGLREPFLQPIRRVDHQRLETVIAGRELGDARDPDEADAPFTAHPADGIDGCPQSLGDILLGEKVG